MNEKLLRLLGSNDSAGLAIIRVLTGITFMAHGAQKLFGLFGGGGLTGTAKFMSSLGLEPSYFMAFLAGLGEFGGGLLLVLGLLTRLGAIGTLSVSIVALLTVHISKGFFMATGGMEYVLILGFISLALVIDGGGKWSMDKYLLDMNQKNNTNKVGE